MSSIKSRLLKKPLLSALSIASVLGLLVGGFSWKAMNSKVDRGPATVIRTSKDFSLKGKGSRPFQINLNSNLTSSFSENTEIKIDAQIAHLRGGLREVFYKWILPEGVKAVDGDLDDSWANVPSGQALKTHLSLSGFDPGLNQHVVLQAWYEEAGVRFAGSAIFVTKPDETLEQQAVQKLLDQESE